jgi:hypothetical protein
MAKEDLNLPGEGSGGKLSNILGDVKGAFSAVNTMVDGVLAKLDRLDAKLGNSASKLTQAAQLTGRMDGFNTTVMATPPRETNKPASTMGAQPTLPGMEKAGVATVSLNSANTNVPAGAAAAASGGGSGGFFTNNKGLMAYNAAAYAAGKFPSGQEAFQQDLLTNRASFYNLGGYDGRKEFDMKGNKDRPDGAWQSGWNKSDSNNNVNNLQNTLNKRGTVTDKLDATQAIIQAQNQGTVGGSQKNFNDIMAANADMSNITPGIGIQGSTRAYGAVQQARNVNMLRGIGIQIRDENGNMKPMTAIVDQLWGKIKGQVIGGQTITVRDVQISLQPGNALHSMLDQYFGNDPYLRKQVEDALIYKAKTGGASLANNKQILRDTGGTTEAVTSLSDRTAAASRIQQLTAGSQMAGQTANNWMHQMASKAGLAMLPILNAAAYLKGLAGLEQGGPATGKTPYIVGEKGPELFVPKTDGIVVPHHLTEAIGRHHGGPVHAGGMSLPFLSGFGAFDYSKSDPKAAALHRFLVSQGMAPNAATGVIGNLVAESNLRTNANGDGGTSLGIAQWHKGRKDALIKYAEKMGLKPTDMAAQQQFLIKELGQSQYKGLWAELSNTSTTSARAADQFMRVFERPKLYGEGENKGDAQAATRHALGIKAMTGVWKAPTQGNSTPYGSSPTTGGDNSFFGGIANAFSNVFKSVLSGGGNFASALGVSKNSNVSGAHTYNYGGVTVNISAPPGTSPDSIGAAIKKALSDSVTLTMLGQS